MRQFLLIYSDKMDYLKFYAVHGMKWVMFTESTMPLHYFIYMWGKCILLNEEDYVKSENVI